MQNNTLYKIGEVASMLGVHEDTLRKWEEDGLVVPERIGKRKDRRYTAEHIKQIKEQGLVSDLVRRVAQQKDYSTYTKDQLIKELHLLKKQKKYGLVWEDAIEEVVERCKVAIPTLERTPAMEVQGKQGEQHHIMIEGDNYHALQVLNYTHKGKVDVIYIDPPYNTGARDWKYNNDYVDSNDQFRHSKWLSMMNNRLKLAKNLLKKDGVLVCAIDKNEQSRLSLLLEQIFDTHEHTCITVVHNIKGNQGKNFSYNNEYAIFVHPYESRIKKISRDLWWSPLRDSGRDSLRENAKNCFYPIIVKNKKIVGFGDVVSDRQIINESNVKKKDGSIYVYPVDASGIARKWRYARHTIENVGHLKAEINNRKINIKIGKDEALEKTVWDDVKFDASTHGTNVLKSIMDGEKIFDYPKSIYTVLHTLEISTKKDSIILDFFAGSGTTGHAVMELNKEDGGNRQFILCTNNENNNGNGEGGIARTVCQPRIKKVIKGYKKNGDGDAVEGLGGNLHYFKTDFVDTDDSIDRVSDDKKLEFTHKAGQLIALRENAFTEIAKNKHYQIFTNEKKNKMVGIYFKENLEKLSDLENKVIQDDKEVKLYIFSHGTENDWESDYEEYDNVVVEDIPGPILKIYKELNL